MFNLYLGLTMIFYAAFPGTGTTVNQYFTIPYVKRHVLTPYIPQFEVQLAIMFCIKFLFFLLVSHVVIRLSKVDRLINTKAPVSLLIIAASAAITFVSIYYRIHSTNDFRAFVISMSQLIIIFSFIRLYAQNIEQQSNEHI